MIEYIIITIVVGIGLAGIRIVRPTHKLLVETLGKWTKTKKTSLGSPQGRKNL